MRLTSAELVREAAAAGFQPESLAKVIRLMELLEGIRSHPFLGTRVALKGGTALNLFVFDMPRLSVDVDLNYVGTAAREGLLSDRPKVEQAIQAVCGRLGLQTRRVPTEHAGGKWRLSYQEVGGANATLELDVNFWTQALVSDCRELLSVVLPLTADERGFLSRLNDRGDIVPELLTRDNEVQALIRSHPGLLWKALNVRRHRGVENNED